jgi:hypothetical protein
LAPEQVGQVIHQALTSARPHVRYAVLRQRITGYEIPRRLPARMVDRAIARGLGLRRK